MEEEDKEMDDGQWHGHLVMVMVVVNCMGNKAWAPEARGGAWRASNKKSGPEGPLHF